MCKNKLFFRVDWIIFLFFVFSSVVLIAYFTGKGALEYKNDNDLVTYSLFYNCLISSGIPSCLEKVGTSFEYFFYFCSYILTLFSPNYNYYIFLYSLILNTVILTTIIVMVRPLGLPIVIICVIYLLSDPRFYELSGNVLRHGLATTMMLFVVYSTTSFRTRGLSKLLAGVPVLSHVSCFGYLVVFIKNRIFDNRAFWLFVFVVLFSFSGPIFNFLIDNYSGFYITNKLNYYMDNGFYPDRIFPYHVLLVILLSFIIDVNIYKYHIVRRVMYSYVALALLFSPLGMSYRYISFMYPLCAIVFAYQMNFIFNLIKCKELVFFAYYITVSALIFMLFRNYERILPFFSVVV